MLPTDVVYGKSNTHNGLWTRERLVLIDRWIKYSEMAVKQNVT
jgi:hypothetical protein